MAGRLLYLRAMRVTRTVTHFAALVLLAAGLAGCGRMVGQPGSIRPAHTQSFPSEDASPLPAGVDAVTGLEQRPMRPPALAANETCTPSSITDLPLASPNYGAGVGPAHLSGQDSWYSAGEDAVLMVDSKYSGPLLMRPFQMGGDGRSTLTLAELPSPAAASAAHEEAKNGMAVVSPIHTAGGGLYFAAVIPTSAWRAWDGFLATDGAGCFGLQVDGDVFTEFIVIEVNPGTSPGG